MAPKICSTSFPAAVLVSMLSVRLTKRMLRFLEPLHPLDQLAKVAAQAIQPPHDERVARLQIFLRKGELMPPLRYAGDLFLVDVPQPYFSSAETCIPKSWSSVETRA
jgi:hypothetical protein